MEKYKSFETERLLLKPTSTKDAPFILELMNTPKWIQNIGDRNIKNIEAAKEYIKTKILPQLERLGYSNYTVIRKSDQMKIGSCGLYDREGLDIGFAFLPQFEGKGYGFESVKRVKEAAINEFGMNMIKAITSKENIASQKLLEKIGLKLVGTTLLPNDDEELLLYQIDI